jgi:hypothetical protein
MARFSLTGVPLGIRSKPYDIDNGDGTRNTGVSHRLVFFDPEATVAQDVAIQSAHLGLFQSLLAGVGQGEVVSLDVDVFANSTRGGGATLSITAVPPAPASAERKTA